MSFNFPDVLGNALMLANHTGALHAAIALVAEVGLIPLVPQATSEHISTGVNFSLFQRPWNLVPSIV